eukprot:c17998_g1_i1 orf=259-525(+)
MPKQTEHTLPMDAQSSLKLTALPGPHLLVENEHNELSIHWKSALLALAPRDTAESLLVHCCSLPNIYSSARKRSQLAAACTPRRTPCL